MWPSCGLKLASPDMCNSQNAVLKSRKERKMRLQFGLGEKRKFVRWRVHRKHTHVGRQEDDRKLTLKDID
jgi:hypothetical protein